MNNISNTQCVLTPSNRKGHARRIYALLKVGASMRSTYHATKFYASGSLIDIESQSRRSDVGLKSSLNQTKTHSKIYTQTSNLNQWRLAA